MVTPMGLCPPWPGASRASCPGASSLSWCCQCLPLSLCHGWLHWLGSEGPEPHSASPRLVLPPCLLAGRAGASATHPPSLSINLLGKHSLEQGSLSVCLSMMVLPMGSPRHCGFPCAVWFAGVLLLPWAYCLHDSNAGRILPGQAEGPLLPISLGELVLGFILLLPSLPPSRASTDPLVRAGSVQVWAGTSAYLPELPSAASPPCWFPASWCVGSVPCGFLGKPGAH